MNVIMKRFLFPQGHYWLLITTMIFIFFSSCTNSKEKTPKALSSKETLYIHEETESDLRLEADSSIVQWEEEFEGGQQKDNAESYKMVDEERVKVDKLFKRIIDKSDPYREIYNKWSALMVVMIDFLENETYGEPFYSMQPTEFNADIYHWYQVMESHANTDFDIIFDDLNYPASSQRTADLKIDDTQKRIRIALEDWLSERSKFATTLQPLQKQSFDNHTEYLKKWYIKEIHGLKTTRNDNKMGIKAPESCPPLQ